MFRPRPICGPDGVTCRRQDLGRSSGGDMSAVSPGEAATGLRMLLATGPLSLFRVTPPVIHSFENSSKYSLMIHLSARSISCDTPNSGLRSYLVTS